MFVPTNSDGGHNSHTDLYDGHEEAGDIYDSEPLILTPPSGKTFYRCTRTTNFLGI